MCESTEEDLRAKQATALGMKANMEAKLAYAVGVSKVLQMSGEYIQKQFGPVGDSQATNLGQAEKVNKEKKIDLHVLTSRLAAPKGPTHAHPSALPPGDKLIMEAMEKARRRKCDRNRILLLAVPTKRGANAAAWARSEITQDSPRGQKSQGGYATQ